MLKATESHIRKHWFPDHKATVTQQGDLKVLTWKKDGTMMYGVRYVFDGSRMYVTGDLGEALFCFTELVNVHTFVDYHLDYFEEKLRAYHEDKREFNSDKAVSRLRECARIESKQQEIRPRNNERAFR